MLLDGVERVWTILKEFVIGLGTSRRTNNKKSISNLPDMMTFILVPVTMEILLDFVEENQFFFIWLLFLISYIQNEF